ncbi:MAG: hypothetical protein IKY29_00105, partial [Clostridia bacterium]|nr:hypothetical protein [Clostridia bacterium]
KDTGEFTLCFYIQGSSYSKEDYYIRPGIFINALMPCDDFYGHFMFEIAPSTPEDVANKFDNWCEEWTNKSLIKKRLLAFIEWEERNPLEKRRAGLVDYETDPVPAREFFSITLPTKQFILDNF